MQNIQLTIKRMLLRRLYPGLRNAADGTLNTLMQRRSPLVEGENIGNNVPEFFQQIGGLGGGGNANVNPNMNVAE